MGAIMQRRRGAWEGKWGRCCIWRIWSSEAPIAEGFKCSGGLDANSRIRQARREGRDRLEGGGLHETPGERMGKARANEKEQQQYSRRQLCLVDRDGNGNGNRFSSSKWQLMRSKLQRFGNLRHSKWWIAGESASNDVGRFTCRRDNPATSQAGHDDPASRSEKRTNEEGTNARRKLPTRASSSPTSHSLY